MATGTMRLWCQKNPLILKEETTVLSHAGDRIEKITKKVREEDSEHSKYILRAPPHYFYHIIPLYYSFIY